MTALDYAEQLVRAFEGCRLTAYQDSVGVWTIGWGSTRGVGPGLTIGQDDAVRLLQRDLAVAASGVAVLVPVPLSDERRGALIDFTFNLGSGNLRASTLRRKILRGDLDGASAEFPRWIYAGGRRLRGLVLRRAAERALWDQG